MNDLVRELRRLRYQAGQPSYRDLANRSGVASHDTMAALFGGRRIPGWRIVHGVVLFLGGDSDRFLALWRAATGEDDTQEPMRDMRDDRLISVRMGVLIGEALVMDGVSQAEFARRVGASEKHVSRVINGLAAASPELLNYWAFVLNRHWTVALEPRETDR